MKFDDDAGVIPNAKELTVLKIASVSPATTQEVFMELRVLRTTATNWNLWFYNDHDDLVWGSSLNVYNYRRWWYVSIGNNNDSLEQSLRIKIDANVDRTITLVGSEPWDFAGLNLRVFANNPLATDFYNGKIGKIDFIAGYYDLNDNMYTNFDRGLPNVIYLLDFTDPEHTQYFSNAMTASGYEDAIRGVHNHTDYGDIPFNPVNEFCQRHVIHHISLPFFRDREYTRQNMIYHMKMRGWGLNHWHRGSESYYNFGRWQSNGNWRHGFRIYKNDYSTRLRLYITYGHNRWVCSYNVEPGFPAH
jgi:hypothetical protein